LTDRGAKVLEHNKASGIEEGAWSERNRSAGRIYFEHELLVADIMVTLELACRRTQGVKFLIEDKILAKSRGSENQHQLFRWKVKIGNLSLGVIPDRVFALEYIKPNGCTERAFFFLEADRGTMPVERKNLTQTSFCRKMLVYEATWSNSIHWKRFGLNRFRVVTVTTNAKRLQSLIACCSKIKKGQGLFLFADSSSISHLANIDAPAWQSCIHSNVSLLD
jgi:hypothetical protein